MEYREVSSVQNLDFTQNLLIVGPPDTGKSSILKSLPIYENALFVDLEESSLVREILSKPEFLEQIIEEVRPGQWLTINRIDRISKCVPRLIEAHVTKKIFIAATVGGSLEDYSNYNSYFQTYFTHTLNYKDVEATTSIHEILNYGTLLKVYNTEKAADKTRYLKNYLRDFLDIEILSKSLVRNLVPFHLFFPLAAQTSGFKVNFSSLAQDLDVDYKTVQYYYELFKDHHLGFYLEAYKKPIRKVQSKASKFYFFDPGFQRVLSNTIDLPLIENSSEFNVLFKSWCIHEVYKKSRSRNLKLSQLETKDGTCLDLIIEKPDEWSCVVIFTAAAKILPKHLKHLNSLGKSFPQAELFCVSTLPTQNDKVIHFKDFFEKVFR